MRRLIAFSLLAALTLGTAATGQAVVESNITITGVQTRLVAKQTWSATVSGTATRGTNDGYMGVQAEFKDPSGASQPAVMNFPIPDQGKTTNWTASRTPITTTGQWEFIIVMYVQVPGQQNPVAKRASIKFDVP